MTTNDVMTVIATCNVLSVGAMTYDFLTTQVKRPFQGLSKKKIRKS